LSHTNTPSPAVLITGASTGIGQACSLELDRRGFRVFAGVRSEASAENVKAKASAQLAPLMIDVTDAASIAAAAETVAKSVGQAGLAGLVNNAGIAVAGPLEALPIDALRKQLEVNVIGQMAVTQAFLPLLRLARGRVVNMSSINGGLAVPYMGAYSASKFALEAITDALRVELRTFGIRVSAVEPAAITTPIWQKSLDSADQLEANVAPELLALYQSDLDAMRRAVDKSIRTALPVERVVRAVVHALMAKRPKTRYFIGPGVRSSFTILKLLPDRLHDRIVRKSIGLP
jgi:NAD(P)-dependent dehydrogenase (short-subunit alcohol dehydrogenase family)